MPRERSDRLAALVPAVVDGLVQEAILVDGGSTDETCLIADAAGTHLINAPRGRGTQLDAGAAAARADWLLFLHADTVLEPSWAEEAKGFIERVESDRRHHAAAFFRFALDDDGLMPRLIEKMVSLRCFVLALPYGDQGLLISRKSATTAAVEAAGLRFNVVGDLKRGRAVFHDFTNKTLIERGEDVEPRTPEEAGDVLANVASEHRFTLYEYFITDKIGHAQDRDAAHALPMLADRYCRLLGKRRLGLTVILTSDHGNIEDLSARNHTLNPVPTIIWGRNREQIASRIHSVVDITPAIVTAFTAD